MANTLMIWLKALALALICILPAKAEQTYTFSVVPQFERRMLFGIWQPIVDELQKRTGLRFELVTALSVGDYENEVSLGNYDFIYINPYMMPKVEKNPGYIPLIRDSKPLHGILIVRKDSPIKGVEDMQGKTLAVPSMTALGASLLLRAELDRQSGIKVQPVIAKTHSSVFVHVINGLADAGGTVQKALAEQEPRIQDAVRVLHRTRDVPSHPIAAHKRVPTAVREKVRQAFIDMSASEQGRKLLNEIPMQQAVPASAEDYRILRTLNLESYNAQ